MRIYHRREGDIARAIDRCFFDATHSRAQLAIERIHDIQSEFPGNVDAIYSEGLLRKDHLGQGLAARELFEKAYHLASPGTKFHAYSACNANLLARDVDEFRKWARLAHDADPRDDRHQHLVAAVEGALSENEPYFAHLCEAAKQYHAEQHFGAAAAFVEVALLHADRMRDEEEVSVRRFRAQCLREMDAADHHHRETIRENFPVAERIALQEAILEIDRALAKDEWDAELWNLKAAWCVLLERHEETITCAERAIAIRPQRYAKPYHNKALALLALKRDDDAKECLAESLRQAEMASDPHDIEHSRRLIQNFSEPRRPPQLSDLEHMVQWVLNAAVLTCQQEFANWPSPLGTGAEPSLTYFVRGSVARSRLLGEGWSMGYVRIMAELLADFSPESVFHIVLRASALSQEFHANCLHAALYVVCHSAGVQRRDAARFLVLSIFGALKGQSIRDVYRKAVLEPSAAARDEMCKLDAIVRAELERMLPRLVPLVADQSRVDEVGRMRAMHDVLSRFAGDIPDVPYRGVNEPRSCPGCGGVGSVAEGLCPICKGTGTVKFDPRFVGCSIMAVLFGLSCAIAWWFQIGWFAPKP